MKVVVAVADILFIFPHFYPCVDVPFGGGKLRLQQCCGSMKFGTDPAIFVIHFQDVTTKYYFFSQIFFAYYFLKVRLHHFSKIKSYKEVKKQ
jgi:hypothetical protein